MEIALFYPAIFEGDLSFQGGRQAVDNASFHLGSDHFRIDDQATVNDANHLINPDPAILPDGDLDDFSHM